MNTTFSNKSRKTTLTALLLTSSLFMSGCSEYLSNINIPNPFEQKQAQSIDAVYYGHFSDIPIPVDMEKDVNTSKVAFYNQQVFGIEKYEGRVEIVSLSTAMEHNLLKNKWSLVAKEHDDKIMQVFQKENRFAIITYYNQTLTTGMDVWVLDKLPQNIVTKNASPAKPSSNNQNRHLTPNVPSRTEAVKQEASQTIDTTVKKIDDTVDKAVEDTTITIDTTKEEVKQEVKEEIKTTSSDIIL